MTKAQLKRSLKLPVVTFYGIGAILGAGIYVLIGEVVAVAGYFAPLSFLAAATIALFSAFSYAELGARFPRSAGEAAYIDEAFGQQWLTRLIGLMVIFTGIVSAATMATGVVGYFQLFIDWPDAVVIALFVLVTGAVAVWGIEESAWVVVVITLLEVGGLFYVIFIAADSMATLSVTKAMLAAPKDSTLLTSIFLGGFLAFYAYIGFEDMVNIAEEIKRPEKILPRAIILALSISTLLYMTVSFAALSVLTPDVLAKSSAPLADVVAAKGESASWVGLISLIAVINGAIVQLIMASRVVYGLASRQLLPVNLAAVNPYTSTPIRASVLCVAITLLLALLFPLVILAQITSIIVLSIFVLVNAALVRINITSPSRETIHYPEYFPYIGFLLCTMMLMIKAGHLLLGSD